MRLEIFMFDAGGGHRATAKALTQVLAMRRPHWQVVAHNLFERIDPERRFERWVGRTPESVYNRRLQSDTTFGLAQELKLLQAMIRLGHRPLVRRLAERWRDAPRPDLVLSVIPNFNRALAAAVAQQLPGVPFVTLMTDLADVPPHFWIEPGTAQHLLVGSAQAARQARAAGVPLARLHRLSGMVLRPAFHAAPESAPPRAAARRALGLDPAQPLGVVACGGHGGHAMLRIARMLPDTPLLMLCGHHARLRQRLQDLDRPAPLAALGFTEDMAAAMRLGDFVIGKPGPGILSESVALGLPVITTLNRATMPQERYNAQWVRDHGVGVVLRDWDGLPGAVRSVLQRLPTLRAACLGMGNHAVFEMPELLERLVGTAQQRAAA